MVQRPPTQSHLCSSGFSAIQLLQCHLWIISASPTTAVPGDVEGFEEVTIKSNNAKSTLRGVLLGRNLPKLSWREQSAQGRDVMLLWHVTRYYWFRYRQLRCHVLLEALCFPGIIVFSGQKVHGGHMDAFWEKRVKLDMTPTAAKLLLLATEPSWEWIRRYSWFVSLIHHIRIQKTVLLSVSRWQNQGPCSVTYMTSTTQSVSKCKDTVIQMKFILSSFIMRCEAQTKHSQIWFF